MLGCLPLLCPWSTNIEASNTEQSIATKTNSHQKTETHDNKILDVKVDIRGETCRRAREIPFPCFLVPFYSLDDDNSTKFEMETT